MGRSRIRPLVSLVVAAALVPPVATVTAAHAAAPPPPTVSVVPSELPVGAAAKPQARIVDGKLLRPGKKAISLASLGSRPGFPHRARGGYLIDFSDYKGSRFLGYRVVFISDSGRKRYVVKGSPYRIEKVASDGRTYIGAKERRKNGRFKQGEILRRIRVSDGRSLGKTLEIAGYPLMMEVTPRRVLTGYVPSNGPHVGAPRTLWWTTSTGKIRVVATGAGYPSGMPETQGASFDSHAFSAVKGGRQVVFDTRTTKRIWKTAVNEALDEFSPDHKKVITTARPSGAGPEESDGYVLRQLSVRNARTGRLLVTFRGVFQGTNSPRPFTAPTHWETSDTFIVRAYDRLVAEDYWHNPEGEAPIRCRVSTATCQRVRDNGVLNARWVVPHSE
ncbi:hypothetical protein [Nocardioides sp. URHA0020]|uniref:hypothetical protein n=1 Tax=Nocardioides sp. URHA0020 TaxID=1380392 RepID=UPI00048A620B|nr:hypothetical protein [Nocardioides sp. URHA0020]